MRTIQELLREAGRYARSYPGVTDPKTRAAIFYSHLAYLINQEVSR